MNDYEIPSTPQITTPQTTSKTQDNPFAKVSNPNIPPELKARLQSLKSEDINLTADQISSIQEILINPKASEEQIRECARTLNIEISPTSSIDAKTLTTDIASTLSPTDIAKIDRGEPLSLNAVNWDTLVEQYPDALAFRPAHQYNPEYPQPLTDIPPTANNSPFANITGLNSNTFNEFEAPHASTLAGFSSPNIFEKKSNEIAEESVETSSQNGVIAQSEDKEKSKIKEDLAIDSNSDTEVNVDVETNSEFLQG